MRPPHPGKHASLTNRTSSRISAESVRTFPRNQGHSLSKSRSADFQQDSRAAQSSRRDSFFCSFGHQEYALRDVNSVRCGRSKGGRHRARRRRQGSRPICELSGRQRQLVSIAEALARQPVLLLLDEPTSAQDLKYQLTVLDSVRSIATESGPAVIAAMCNLNLAGCYGLAQGAGSL